MFHDLKMALTSPDHDVDSTYFGLAMDDATTLPEGFFKDAMLQFSGDASVNSLTVVDVFANYCS